MASQASKRFVFRYDKRRYDGGIEIEMIQQIERQVQLQAQQHAALAASGQTAPLGTVPLTYRGNVVPLAQPEATSAQAEPEIPSTEQVEALKNLSQKEKLHKAFVAPFVELVLGCAGLLVAQLVTIGPLKNNRHKAFDQERTLLIVQSQRVIKDSLFQILSAPWFAMKLLRGKP